jgi:flagellar protein FlgJ
MTAPAAPTTFYADFKSLDALKHDAKTDGRKALRGAAQQFESLFINMMLKSMREATSSVGDSLTGGNEMELYQSMYDQQIATQMSKGKGLGLADLLVQQLTRSGMVKGPAMPGADHAASADKSAVNDVKRTSNIDAATDRVTTNATLQKHEGIRPATSSHAAPIRNSTGRVESIKAVKREQTSATNRISSPAEFVEKMWPHAQRAAKRLGVDPTTLIAHAALETGWGKHVPCHDDGSSSHNLFGIKAGSGWNGNSIGSSTLEFEQGVAVKKVERFKAYDSPEQCFADYAALLSNHSRYGETLNTGSNTAKFAQALQKGGYATDPEYAHKLKAVARSVMSLVSSLENRSSTQLAGVSQAHSGRVDS